MILDQTGSLANVKRHDYLPFGEELDASISGRSGQGYGGGDGVRQQFTQKERDIETGLDYFVLGTMRALRAGSPERILTTSTLRAKKLLIQRTLMSYLEIT
jgi:hypothetical protein